MLIADSVSFKGRHSQLIAPTSLQAQRGEVLLLVAEPQLSRTAMSLVLSGRMRPDEGTVSWQENSALKHLRKHSALVDSPEINAPEPHLKVRDVVAEDLSLAPLPIWRKRGINSWLAQHGFAEVADQWIDSVDPLTRMNLMAKLGVEHQPARLIIFDSPERHGIEETQWLQLLEDFAQSRRSPAVVAVVARAPQCWDGPLAYLGEQNAHLLPTETDLDFDAVDSGGSNIAVDPDLATSALPAQDLSAVPARTNHHPMSAADSEEQPATPEPQLPAGTEQNAAPAPTDIPCAERLPKD